MRIIYFLVFRILYWNMIFLSVFLLFGKPELLEDRKLTNGSPLDEQISSRDDAVRLVLGKPFTEEELAEITVPEVEDMMKHCRLGPEDSVLEVGCGVGRFATQFAPNVKEYVGVDLSAELVRYGRERTKDLENVSFEQCNGRDLSLFPDERFNFIFSTIAFIHMDIEDVFGYLLEAYRCLAPGGRAYFDFLNLWDDRVKDKWLSSYTMPRNPVTAQKDPYRTRFVTPYEARLYLEEAGFKIDRMVLDILVRAYVVKDAERSYDGAFRNEHEQNLQQRVQLLSDELASLHGSRAVRIAQRFRNLRTLLTGKRDK